MSRKPYATGKQDVADRPTKKLADAQIPDFRCPFVSCDNAVDRALCEFPMLTQHEALHYWPYLSFPNSASSFFAYSKLEAVETDLVILGVISKSKSFNDSVTLKFGSFTSVA